MLPSYQKKRYFIALAAVGCLYLSSWHFASGAIHYFSPATLDTHVQREVLLPLTEIPIYRSRQQTFRYELVRYLVQKGYWAPTHSNLRAVSTSRWNRQWRDGQSDFHIQCTRRAQSWIDWSEKHPEIAERLWPQVLRLLRSSSRRHYVSHLMHLARDTTELAEFEKFIAANTEFAAAMDRE